MKLNSLKVEIRREIKFPPSPFRVTSQTIQPIRPSKAGLAGTVLQVILEGPGGNLIFLQIFNLHTIQFHILLCLSLLQFARVLVWFWALVPYFLNRKEIPQRNVMKPVTS